MLANNIYKKKKEMIYNPKDVAQCTHKCLMFID